MTSPGAGLLTFLIPRSASFSFSVRCGPGSPWTKMT